MSINNNLKPSNLSRIVFIIFPQCFIYWPHQHTVQSSDNS